MVVIFIEFNGETFEQWYIICRKGSKGWKLVGMEIQVKASPSVRKRYEVGDEVV